MGRSNGVSLTETYINGLEAKNSTYPVPDLKVRGLCIQVTPKGVKSFVLRYRFEGAQRTFTLGRFPSLKVEAARKLAEAALGRIRAGEDPSGTRRQQRAIPTVAELADQFQREYCPLHLRAKTQLGYKEMIKGAILPELGTLKVNSLTQVQVARWHHGLRNTPRKANYALAVLRKMMNLAMTWGFREKGNPCAGIKKYPEISRDRVPNLEELQRIWRAMEKAQVEGWGTIYDLACLELILLTGARKAVIQKLQWRHVDLAAGFLKLPAGTEGTKAKGEQTIALGAEAAALLQGLPRVLGLGSEWVFPGANRKGPTGTLFFVWDKVRVEAKVEDLRIHDLRHLFGTTAAELNFQAPKIQAALNHRTPSMTARYINLADKHKAEVASAVGARLTEWKKVGTADHD